MGSSPNVAAAGCMSAQADALVGAAPSGARGDECKNVQNTHGQSCKALICYFLHGLILESSHVAPQP